MSIRVAAVDSRLLPSGVSLTPEHVQKSMEEVLYSHSNSEMAAMSDSAVERGLEGISPGLQRAIYERIAQMAERKIIAGPSLEEISWPEESKRLIDFYKHLLVDESTHSAFKVCEAFRLFGGDRINKAGEDVHSTTSRVREMIGCAVFVAERQLPASLARIDPFKLDGMPEFIAGQVINILTNAQRELSENNRVVNQYSLQNKNIMFSIEEPKMIAELLLTTQGQLNLGMIDMIREWFFPKEGRFFEYQLALLDVLDRIDLSWQKIMDAVEVPADQGSASCAMIRAELGLSPDEVITQLHCKRVILSALLSQLCEEPIGNRYAVAWALKVQNRHFQDAAADYIALVRDGYLTRLVEGGEERFFFENTIANPSLSKEITLNPNGTLRDFRETSFWKCPNFMAACTQMGITDPEEFSALLLQSIFGSETEAQTVSWDDLIYASARIAARSSEEEPHLLKMGRYGFCLSHNRLLTAWQSCLAAVPQAQSSGDVRAKITRCVMATLQGVFSTQETRVEDSQKALIAEVKEVFEKMLNASFHLSYNGSIGPTGGSGYELYRRDPQGAAKERVRIATPEQFHALIDKVINRTLKAEMSQVTSTQELTVVYSVIQGLQFCIDNGAFMKKVLYAYDPEKNFKQHDPVADYQWIQRTPMTSLAAATEDPWDAPILDSGGVFTPDVKKILPAESRDLLKWLLNVARWKETTDSHLRDSVSESQHAFPIEVDPLKLQDFAASSLSTDAWIQKALIDPGMKISKSKMQCSSALLFAQEVKKWLPEGISPAREKEVDALFSILSSPVLTVQQFAQRSHDGLAHICKLKAEHLLALDKILLQSLPAKQSRAIHEASVRFAPANKDSFFCCFFNPRTQRVGFGTIAENKTELGPVDTMLVDRRVSS